MGLSEGRRVADPEHPWRTTIITSAPRTVSVRRNGQRSTLPLITVALMVPQEDGRAGKVTLYGGGRRQGRLPT